MLTKINDFTNTFHFSLADSSPELHKIRSLQSHTPLHGSRQQFTANFHHYKQAILSPLTLLKFRCIIFSFLTT